VADAQLLVREGTASMNGSPDQGAHDGDQQDEIPKHFLMLLTPACDICHRVDPESFIVFVQNMVHAVDDGFCNLPVSKCVEVRAACALLPGSRKLVELQAQPPDDVSAQVKHITDLIQDMPAPEVTGGPVTFFRHAVFGPHAAKEIACRPPFLGLPRPPRAVLLDEVLLQASGISLATKSLWRRFTGLFRPEQHPVPTIAEQEVVRRLSEHIGLPVVCSSRRLNIDYLAV
jgi:hypothetical protein